MLRHVLAVIAVGALSACGSYRTVVLYEPSTATMAATFVPGDGCSQPRYGFGTVSSARNAMVFIRVAGQEDRPSLQLSVVIEGVSMFNFVDDRLIFSGADGTVGISTIAMNSFKFSTGGGAYSAREFHPRDVFVGPPRASFKPHYREDSYEKQQWSFSSEMAVPVSRPERFSVQIPAAVIDGEKLSFPLVTFHRREKGHREFCLK